MSTGELSPPGILEISGVLGSFFLLGCNLFSFTQEQNKLHLQAHEHYKKAFSDAKNEVELSAGLLKACLHSKPECPREQKAADTLSNLYIPSFSKPGPILTLFTESSAHLEYRWDHFLKLHPYISWIYAFDGHSGTLRIAPATPAGIVFGDAMDFREFKFYQSAVARAPEASFISKTRSKELLFFAYLKSDQGYRELISEYSFPEAQWLSLKAIKESGEFSLHVSPLSLGQIFQMEDLIQKEIMVRDIRLGEATYQCSVSTIDHPKVFLWICAR